MIKITEEKRVRKRSEIPYKPKKTKGLVAEECVKLFKEFLNKPEEKKLVIEIGKAKNAVSALLGGALKNCWMAMKGHNPVADLVRVELIDESLYLEFQKRE